jgi:hypothetical protein
MKTVLNRLYADYLMPSRLGEYEAILRQARDLGYTQLTVRDFFRTVTQGETPPRALVNRHYEEAATFAKQHRVRNADVLRQRFPEIRQLFVRNFETIAEALGRPLATVASHGDFANRRLNVINHELLQDAALRARCGIECEAYDEALLRHVDMYISDRKYPVYYRPVSPFDALGRNQRIMFLTHPVQWETNWVDNTRCNARRLMEELAWRA